MTIPCDPPSAPQAAGTMKKKLIPALLGGAVGPVRREKRMRSAWTPTGKRWKAA